jgi:outer membrane murein-binding lipoprotein Lpp
MKTLGINAALLAVGSMLLFGCSHQAKTEKAKVEIRTAYADTAQWVMIRMGMSGRYQSVSATNSNGEWTITATIR